MQEVPRREKRPPDWYEVFDDKEKLKGFVWMFDGRWHVRIDEHDIEHFSTQSEAFNRAHEFVFGHPGSWLLKAK